MGPLCPLLGEFMRFDDDKLTGQHKALHIIMLFNCQAFINIFFFHLVQNMEGHFIRVYGGTWFLFCFRLKYDLVPHWR